MWGSIESQPETAFLQGNDPVFISKITFKFNGLIFRWLKNQRFIFSFTTPILMHWSTPRLSWNIMEVSKNSKSSSSLFPPIHNTRFLGDNFKMLNFLSFSKLCNDTGTWSRRQLTVLCFSLTKNLFLKRFFFKESDLIWLLSSLENFHKCKIHPHTMSLIIRQVLLLVHLISPYLSFQEQWHVANTI